MDHSVSGTIANVLTNTSIDMGISMIWWGVHNWDQVYYLYSLYPNGGPANSNASPSTIGVLETQTTQVASSGSFTVNSSSALNSTLAVGGAATFNDDITVSGASHLADTLAVDGAATLSDELVVAGPSTLNNTLTVTGASNLNSVLSVQGAATFQNNVVVNGSFTVLGNQTSVNTTILEVKDNAILIADSNDADTLQSGLQIQYKPSGSSTAKYAGLKRLPTSGPFGGEFILFREATEKISETAPTTTSDVYAGIMAESFACASDARLKKNIVTLDGALNRLDDIRGVYHDWIDENQSTKRQIGVIAQEVQEVYPELVSTGANGYLSVDYPKLTAVLLQSVKELKAMVLELAMKQ
jgi:hypothetical protein